MLYRPLQAQYLQEIILKALFLHGLASSGAFKTAASLHHLLRPCDVISPDIPIDPDEALGMLEAICNEEHPDLVVGHSMGGFWAQMLRGYRKILINPAFHPSKIMRTMTGEMKYLSPRRDGALSFTISEELCDRYLALEQHQFDGIVPTEISMTRAMFADEDEIVNCLEEFESHYPGCSVRYHGRHIPSHPELKSVLVQIASDLCANY